MAYVLDTNVAIHLRDGSAIPTLAFDDDSADAYRAIVAQASYSRRKLLDRTIAAQALVHRATLVTTNPDDFADILGWNYLRGDHGVTSTRRVNWCSRCGRNALPVRGARFTLRA